MKKSLISMALIGLLSFGMVLGCDTGTSPGTGTDPTNPTDPTDPADPGNNPPVNDITFTVAADGVQSSQNSTVLTFTFSSEVTGLKYSEITITNDVGEAEKARTNPNSISGTVWTLDINAIKQGNVKVSISKAEIESQLHDVYINDLVVAPEYIGTYKDEYSDEYEILEINKIISQSQYGSSTSKAWTSGTMLFIAGNWSGTFEGTTLKIGTHTYIKQ
jgi:hypothetical protein